MKQDKKNKGFSLVELLVSITILAIIAVPIMHGFVSASKTNAKARKIEQATTVAQNVMEDVKATPLEELLTREGVMPNTITELGNDGSVKTESIEYTIPYESQFADGVEYRAVVTMDTGASTDDGSVYATDYNQTEFAQLYDMNTVYDAFFILEDATDTAMISKLAQTARVSESTVKAAVKRNIYVDIKNESGTEMVEVNVSYTYGDNTCYMAAQNQCIYSNLDIETYLRNVYVFFPSLSNMREGEDAKETITIRNAGCNAATEPVSIYLVKQSGEADENYSVNVNLMEASRDLATYQDENGNLLVKTKICTNLSFPRSTSDTSADEINVFYSTWDGNYSESLSILGITYDADTLVGLEDLSAQKKQDLVYNVTVNVYEKDADESEEALFTLVGTKEK